MNKIGFLTYYKDGKIKIKPYGDTLEKDCISEILSWKDKKEDGFIGSHLKRYGTELEKQLELERENIKHDRLSTG